MALVAFWLLGALLVYCTDDTYDLRGAPLKYQVVCGLAFVILYPLYFLDSLLFLPVRIYAEAGGYDVVG